MNVAIADLGRRTQIRVGGADRVKFLHGLCTNDVKSLVPGQGRECFFTNVQGKTIGHAFLFCRDDAIDIDTTPSQADTLLPQLDRYIIREDVQLTDMTDQQCELLVAGLDAPAPLSERFRCTLPHERLSHVNAELAGTISNIRRVDWISPDCFFVAHANADAARLFAAFQSWGATTLDESDVEAARIEHKMPYFGRDITAANLPQEVARDALAISFTKGCYLGQETVARIDALGHVNRYLVGLRLPGDKPPPLGMKLYIDEKTVGEITSSAWSKLAAAAVALAYVRRGHHAPGTKLDTEIGEAVVV